MRVSTLSGPYGLFPGRKRFGGLRVHEIAGYSDLLPSFWVPFADLGAGVVSLTEIRTNATPTFTRATTAWTRLSTGLWASVASGSPRSYYDANLIYRGFLCEGATTNRCLQSRDLNTAAWTASNITPAKTQTGIDGVANSCSLITASAGNGTILQGITSASAARSFSCWMKRAVGTGTISLTLDNGSTYTDITSQINSSTFSLVQAQQTVTNPTVGFKITTSGDAVIVDMCQEETGAFATTPYPATVAAVTRNDDVLSYPIGNINNAVGSAYGEAVLWRGQSVTGVNRHLLANTGNASSRTIYIAGGTTTVSVFDGTSVVQSSSISLSGAIKGATAWGVSLSSTANGGTTTVGAFDGNLGATTAIQVAGIIGVGSLYGALKNCKIFNRELSPSQLSALTA